MNFDNKQMNEIEWELGRVVSAVSQFADKATIEKLKAATYIIAEVRNAGYYLSDAECGALIKEQAAMRLCELFKEN